MINNSGQGYWATGVSVCWHPGSSVRDGVRHDGWSARVKFYDDGFCSDDADAGSVSTEGALYTRYAVRDGETAAGLRVALDVLIADAQRLGITFHGVANRSPSIHYRGDGGDPDYPPPPGWVQMLEAEAERIGWEAA